MPILGHTLQCIVPSWLQTLYDECPEIKDTKVLNMYNIFNLKSDTVNELPVHNFIFQHCPNIYEVLEPTYVSPSHRSLPPALPRQRSKLGYRSFVRREHPSFTAPLRHVLPIHNVTIHSNNLWISAGRSPFALKNYDGTHLAFGRTLDRRCHFKHLSLKQSRFYHRQTSTAHR